MSDIIHLLPDSVANQIAAGEVIQRPASVVKELLENAIDAGATAIDLLLTDAGRTCIQVIDNGKGMSETDARMAFERHATSKITAAADLFALGTFGFRGEALPSIVAVAQVEMRTRTADDELGVVLVVEDSRIVRQEPDFCPVGCNIQVKNLFYNVPARRKFLKSNQTELTNCITELERVALVHPDIAFTLHHNGSEVLSFPVTTRRQRILHMFGKKINEELLNVEVETSLGSISGFVGSPESAKHKGAHQYFFVNGRYMRHPYFNKAVQEAFTGLIPDGDQVSYFIYFEVDPGRIDVNIHPTKTEIKFEDEHAIWQILVAAIRETLGKSNAVPSIDFDTRDYPDIPVMPQGTQRVVPPSVTIDPSYNPFQREEGYRRPPIDWQQLYPTPSADGSQQSMTPDAGTTLFGQDDVPAIKNDDRNAESDGSTTSPFECYQFGGRYIITAIGSDLAVIDQHRAHVRVLYDQYRERLARRGGASQGLLFPELLQLTTGEAVHMEQWLQDFAQLGFDINSLGGGSFSIQGVPEGIEGLDVCRLVHEMLAEAMERNSDVADDTHHSLALTMARSAAIIVGQVLSATEMDSLVRRLFTSTLPNYTPDGKRIVTILKENEVEKWFS